MSVWKIIVIWKIITNIHLLSRINISGCLNAGLSCLIDIIDIMVNIDH